MNIYNSMLCESLHFYVDLIFNLFLLLVKKKHLLELNCYHVVLKDFREVTKISPVIFKILVALSSVHVIVFVIMIAPNVSNEFSSNFVGV